MFLLPKDCVYEDLQYGKTSNNLTIEQREEKIKNIIICIVNSLAPELLFLNISSNTTTNINITIDKLKTTKYQNINTALYDYIYSDFDNIIINLDYLKVIEDTEAAIAMLINTDEIDKRIASLTSEIEIVSELVKKLIRENSSANQSQDDYQIKYNELSSRYDKNKKAYEKTM